MLSANGHMTRTSPNQSASVTPGDHDHDHELDGEHDGDDALLARVRLLLAELVPSDEGETPGKQLRAGNNPEEASNTVRTRERLLEDKLSLTLLELASEQDNLRVAASAGNALLEQLQQARDETSALHDELESAELTQERYERDLKRLRDENAALRAQSPELTATDVSRRAQRTTDAKTSCSHCSARDAELLALGRRSDELRRRCLELELAGERGQQRVRELLEELAKLQQRYDHSQEEQARVTRELDFTATQLAQRSQETAELSKTRDALRRTTRRLETEAQELYARVRARDGRLEELEAAQSRMTTQLQVAENRAARAEQETQRVGETLAELTKTQAANGAMQIQEDEGCSRQTRDLETLLQDATREAAALRLENQLLRRQHASVANAGGTRGRRQSHQPRKATWTSGTTAADVLALALEHPVSCSSSSSSSSQEAEPLASELAPLAIEASATLTSTLASAQNSVSESTSTSTSTRPRNVSLGLDWFDEAQTEAVEALTQEQELELETSTDSSQPANENSKPPVMRSRLLPRSQNRCMISDFTEASSPVVRPEASTSTRRSTIAGVNSDELLDEPGVTRGARSNSTGGLDPLEDLRRADTASPPKSPLYLGLSFIACATAAGFLARR